MPTWVYRNDNKKAYFVDDIGEISAGQRVSVQGEYKPRVNLLNYPGLVDVLAEEEAAANPDLPDAPPARDYEKHPEVITHRLADDDPTLSDKQPDDQEQE
jgi:hypothetical protein